MDHYQRASHHAAQVPAARSLTRKLARLTVALGFTLAGLLSDLAQTRTGRFLAFTAAVLALLATIVALGVATVLLVS